MKNIASLLLLGLVVASAFATAESYSAQQCPNFATTEQPYLYLYTSENYQGDPLYLTNASVPNLGNIHTGLGYSSRFNDRMASIRLRGKWRICVDTAYGGECVEVQSKDWKSELMIQSVKSRFGVAFEESVSSVKLLSCSQY